MADIIQLLPESIANQIAAGEVIQRPASVVKELLENSIDAGSTFVQLIAKNAGKTLIQVIDDGSGMSYTDARMCLERHATSKIRKADDLFSIRTMGFRGEAMASIASIAQMTLTTRREEDEIACVLEVSGSKIKKHEHTQAPVGTSISVRNLFYNVPARRKFLKGDSAELKHILEEFKRVALANPQIKFSFKHNDNEVYHLVDNNLRKRIISVFGNRTNDKLVPIDESTDMLTIKGYIGKPSLAKKQRGDQYLFVNNRYIKSTYLNHAIKLAFTSLIHDDQTPFYVLFLTIDPSRIDINVHPTKTEIKFEDERIIYQILRVAVQHGLGKYNVTPSIDFDAENMMQHTPMPSTPTPSSGGSRPVTFASGMRDKSSTQMERDAWSNFYKEIHQSAATPSPDSSVVRIESEASKVGDLPFQQKEPVEKSAYQLHNTYIINQIKSGYIIIHQQYAHERILFEKLMKAHEASNVVSQRLLFPISIDLNPDESAILQRLVQTMQSFGFDITHTGNNNFVVNAMPTVIGESNIHSLILDLVSQEGENLDLNVGLAESLVKKMAQQASLKKNTPMTQDEMTKLIDDLFACEVPYISPSGKKCFVEVNLQSLEAMF